MARDPFRLHSKLTTLAMTNTTNNLSLKLKAFASLLDAQPPEVQEAFQFLLATAMHEAGKFELISVAEVDGQRKRSEK